MVLDMLREFVQLASELATRFRSPPAARKDRGRFVTECYRRLERLRDLNSDIREDLEYPERQRDLPGRGQAAVKIRAFLESFEKVFERQFVALRHVPNAAEGAEKDDLWWKRFTFHVYVEPPPGSPPRNQEEIAQAMERDLSPLEHFEKELQGMQKWLEGLRGTPTAPSPTCTEREGTNASFSALPRVLDAALSKAWKHLSNRKEVGDLVEDLKKKSRSGKHRVLQKLRELGLVKRVPNRNVYQVYDAPIPAEERDA